MTLILTQLESELRDHLGVATNDPQFGTDALDLLLNRAYWDMLDKFKFREKEASGLFYTVAGTRYYDVPVSFDYLTGLFIVDSSGNHIQLDRASIPELEGVYNESTSSQGFPTKYTREGCGIKLLPTPDAIYTGVIKFMLNLADLSTSNVTPSIPHIWHECIVYGAAYRGFLKLGDFPRYQQYISLYNAKVVEIEPVESKEEEDSTFGGAECVRPSYNLL